MDCANSALEEMRCIQVNRVTERERERSEFLAPEVTCLWYAENDTSWKGGIVYGQPGSQCVVGYQEPKKPPSIRLWCLCGCNYTRLLA